MPLPDDWIATAKLLAELWPDWNATPSQIALFESRLAHLDQRRVRRAIEEHKIRSGHYRAPDLGEILDRCHGGDNGQRDEHAEWDRFVCSLPVNQQRVLTHYCRLWSIASSAEQAMIAGRFRPFAELMHRNPLGLGADDLIDNRDLPKLLHDLIEWIRNDTAEPTRDDCINAGRQWWPLLRAKLKRTTTGMMPDYAPEPRHRRIESIRQAAEATAGTDHDRRKARQTETAGSFLGGTP